MRWLHWPFGGRGSTEDVTDLAHAENRMHSVEKRADIATRTILSRNDRNHWTETIRQTIREERA